MLPTWVQCRRLIPRHEIESIPLSSQIGGLDQDIALPYLYSWLALEIAGSGEWISNCFVLGVN